MSRIAFKAPVVDQNAVDVAVGAQLAVELRSLMSELATHTARARQLEERVVVVVARLANRCAELAEPLHRLQAMVSAERPVGRPIKVVLK